MLPTTTTISTWHLPSIPGNGDAGDTTTVSNANATAATNEHDYGGTKSDDAACNSTTARHFHAAQQAPSHARHPRKLQQEHQWMPNGTIRKLNNHVRQTT